mmetsp:Transcript_18333/g.29831  ORF Transcript_18333/g.29831 Transcript_18333/m.29831 type:complete len:253 (-) Transcript_18333:83-841(-)
MATLETLGNGVSLITLQSTLNERGEYENCFTPSLINIIHRLLDEIIATEGPAAIVFTSKGKFFSNGHDIKWLESAVKRGDGTAERFIDSFYNLLARLMTLPIFTIAAINGHAFAGGCLFAMAMDFRVMRSDRGYICMNEIDMQIPKTGVKSVIKPGIFPDADAKLVAVLESKLSTPQVREVLLQGKRYTGADALQNGIVEQTLLGESETVQAAVKLGQEYALKCVPRNRSTVSVLKSELARKSLPILTNAKL